MENDKPFHNPKSVNFKNHALKWGNYWAKEDTFQMEPTESNNWFRNQFMEKPLPLYHYIPKQYLIEYDKVSSSGITFKKGGMSSPPLVALMYDDRQIGFARVTKEESGILCEQVELFHTADLKLRTSHLTTSFEVTLPNRNLWKATGKTLPVELGHIRYVEFADRSDWMSYGQKIGSTDGNIETSTL